MLSQKSFQEHQDGTLYLVPTPIGNLADMTFRSVEVLKEVELILAEDTRNTQKLLNHFEIKTKQLSFHEFSSEKRIPEVIEKLKNGINIAQVSDAGMPSISDPGHDLVMAAIDVDIPVVPLPGASAGITALIASGIDPQPFEFYGFLPRKTKEQKEVLKKISDVNHTLIFYEAPHRLAKTIQNFKETFDDDRKITLARELTKRYEEFVRGTIGEVFEWTQNNEIRGEFVIILEKSGEDLIERNADLELPIRDHVQKIIDEEDIKPNQAIKKVAKLRGMVKQDVYNIFHELG
ncbi:16S rRNA (cytidine(1402)-2'-O)-methyltransferase [Pediococcus claussenii]|uniref:Ribosomal RNA small subunit methyltransferase I n=1 Tax=Pediococcus claussenii (strain ATCC BAA-344 / DSM 14800 / JCM 18046 / KCTC 3811 / LMG 21948 / P06) TaxID=701521 RepID=G8PBQ6_PEDCP|nr:16S rRNA (cytidine(1402)-2'-O)-methyltransferase [Pediococcus claussenii]AEV94805.1 ribosomal RNA small subunit methyltransferase I [Pediococcus claussenii ATCC BAA-344]ANZ70002.1 rRNA (cytidine-2'-O-)-methyltransferase [Pediococcus claussenii]ANZ71817.1 rRNA (cytidine-2'-O-)-methyltransferase [Pediococcus claussenii]KRN20984.1 rsmI protein [Pediococcus claussenii]